MEVAIRYEQVNFRMPEGMKDTLKEMARRNRRTMGSEVVFHLEKALLINEARLLFGDKAAAELAARTAATGEGFADMPPAAAQNDDRVGSAVAHQPRF